MRFANHKPIVLMGFCLIAVLLGAVLLPAATAADALGWRGDGGGKYAGAGPITEWSPDKNVIWKTPMPGFTNSSPVIVGDRLFTCAEPTTLLCVDIADGRILWQRTHNFEDMVDADTSANWAKEREEAAGIRKQVYKTGGGVRRLRLKLQDNPEDEELKAEYAAAEESLVALQSKLAPYDNAWHSMPDADKDCGYTSPTPVSDGERIYVMFGTGWLACYDLDGNNVWGRMVEKPHTHHGFSASPVLVDGKLILHVHHVIAVDKDTGETLWRTEEESWSWGTPARARIGETAVVITGWGDVLRVDDGEVLLRGLPRMLMQGPAVEGDILYFIDKDAGKAFKLPDTINGDELTLEEVWETQPGNARYYASPVVHDGLIYAWNQKGELRVIDALTGDVAYEEHPKLGARKSYHYPSVTLAGDLLFVSAENGATVVIKPGRQYEEVARNELEPFYSSPVFIEDRVYVRGRENLYCLGEVGAGR